MFDTRAAAAVEVDLRAAAVYILKVDTLSGRALIGDCNEGAGVRFDCHFWICAESPRRGAVDLDFKSTSPLKVAVVLGEYVPGSMMNVFWLVASASRAAIMSAYSPLSTFLVRFTGSLFIDPTSSSTVD